MTDRVPGAPGRCIAVVTDEELQKLQAGEEFAITLRRDDQPVREGTPYSKAAVLPDAVAGQLCPGLEDPTPGDAFAALQSQKADTVRQGAGENIILNNAAHTPLMGLKLYGNKNLLDYRKAIPRNDNETVEIDEENECIYWTGTYYFYIPLPCVITAGTTLILSCQSKCEDNPDNYCGAWQIKYEDGTIAYVGPIGTYSITASQNVTEVWIRRVLTESTDTIKIWDIQLEIGATATDYMPYLADRDVTVKVMGKNLWDEQWENGGISTLSATQGTDKYGAVDDSATAVGNSIRSKNFIPVKEGVTLQCYLPQMAKVVYYDSDKQGVSITYPNPNGTLTPAQDGYIKFVIGGTVGSLSAVTEYGNNICISIADGSEAAYEPYKEPQTLTVSVPDGLLNNGEMRDEIDFANGVMIRRVAEQSETALPDDVLEAYGKLHTYSPTTVIFNDAGADMEIVYYTHSTAVQMVHAPADKDKLLSIDEHGCVILVERDSVTEKAMQAVAALESDVTQSVEAVEAGVSEAAEKNQLLYEWLIGHTSNMENPHAVTAKQLTDMADFVTSHKTDDWDVIWWNNGTVECSGQVAVAANGTDSNWDHCNIYSQLPEHFTHFHSVQVAVLSNNPTDPGDSQYADTLSNILMSVFNIDAEAEVERLVVRFGIYQAGAYSLLSQDVSKVRLSVRVCGTVS